MVVPGCANVLENVYLLALYSIVSDDHILNRIRYHDKVELLNRKSDNYTRGISDIDHTNR